ncbi:MAG: glycosyltransferase family 2 protein [Chitinispirillaceae bacterium]|jgi:glycosyltransferase involved in cell wall biosynthesis
MTTPVSDKPAVSAAAPMVSVIVPTFNRPDLLAEAVRSVLDQTEKDFEVIVVNDGSIDVAPFLKSIDPMGRVRCIDNKGNRGRSYSRNAGIHAAQGKYIAYLDDDDRYYPDHLKTLTGFLESSGRAVAYTDALCVVQVKKENEGYVVVKKEVRYSNDFCPRTILWRNLTPLLCLVHARSCCDRAGYFDETLETHEDWDLIIRLSRQYDPYHIKKVTAEYSFRYDGSSTTSGSPGDFLRSQLMIYNKYRAFAAHDWRVKHKQRKSIRDCKKRLLAQGFSKKELDAMVKEISNRGLPAGRISK